MVKDKKLVAIECEQWFCLSLHEVSNSLGVTTDFIIDMIDEGIITVSKIENDEWFFDSETIGWIQSVLRLNQDLGVNLAGAGLVLNLLQKIEHLEMLLARYQTRKLD